MPETEKSGGDAIEEFIERHLADAAEAIVEEDVARTAASERLKRYVEPQPPAAILSPPISPAIGPSWLPTWLPSGFALVGCLVVALIIVGGGALLLLGGGLGPPPVGQASPTPSPTAMVAATETPTGSPPEAPTEVPTPTPTPTPEGKTNAFTPDETGDATTDSGAPAPDDKVVDITQVTVTKHADGSVDVRVDHGAPLPSDAHPMVSRAEQVLLGIFVEANAEPGIVLAQQRFQAFAVFYWELHDGRLSMGELDPSTRQPLDSPVVIEHLADSGTFIFHIPAERIPEGATALGVLSFHRPTPDDERRRDNAGLYSLEF